MKPQKGRRVPPPSLIKLGTKIKDNQKEELPVLGLCSICGKCVEKDDLDAYGCCEECFLGDE